MQPGRERQLVTSALLLGMFMAALEATAVAAAVPTAVGEMGGVSRYSWVFSAYLLTSTTTMPLYGKLADLYGRRVVYHVAMALFLLGSALSGLAGSLPLLILFRAVQGLGAGGVMPVAGTLIGDIYTLEERGRMQGVFSGVWALASLVGPLLGGWLTDAVSWRWIFFVNIPFGLASSLLLQRYLPGEPQRHDHRLDVLGTVSLTTAITLLLIALTEGPEAWGWGDPRTVGLLAGAGAALAVFFWQETRAAEPILPLGLFRNRLIAVASAGNLVIGTVLFALTAFVPIFGQGVLGGSAVDAGVLLSPVLVGWPVSSTIAGWLLMRVGYRRMAVFGSLLLAAGGLLLARTGPDTTRLDVMTATFVIGLGMGFAALPYFLGPQNAVPWSQRGVVTSSVQFFRSIGGAVGVAALGALLNHRLGRLARLGEGGGGSLDANAALEPGLRAALPPADLARLTGALLDGLHAVYVVIAALALASVGVALLFPGGSPQSLVHSEVTARTAASPSGRPRADGS